MLSDACATAATQADELIRQISDLRDRWSGRAARQGDHQEKLRIELERALEEQKMLFSADGRLRLTFSAGVGRGWRPCRLGPCSSKSFLTSRMAWLLATCARASGN
jgi:hypothetical protein